MKPLYDLFPAILFYVVYQLWGIYWATGVLIITTGLQLAYVWFKHKRLDKLLLIIFLLVFVFGGLTIILHDAEFLQWKVSIVNWLFGTAFLGSAWFTKKPLIQRFLEKSVALPDKVWRHLNYGWAGYFIFIGCINLFVALTFSLNAWVDFKTFGLIGCTILFVVIQSIYLHKQMK
jgi:intracellular septation protein